ncbi:MAG: hypothetical protein ACSLFM_00285 [Tepidiformaceae bacterium]
MEWVRGGRWEPRQFPFQADDFNAGRFAVLDPMWMASGTGSAGPLFESLTDERTRDEWWAEIGADAGLEPYTLVPQVAARILHDATQLYDEYPHEIPFAATPELDEALCAFLERNGPLWPALGVTPGCRDQDWGNARSVPLWWLYVEIGGLAGAWRGTRRANWKRAEFAAYLREAAESALVDMVPVPRFEPEGVVWDPVPRSLRAYLWMHLFGLWELADRRVCVLCGDDFELAFARGRPPSYCPDHRSSRDRKRRARLEVLRPAGGSPSEED